MPITLLMVLKVDQRWLLYRAYNLQCTGAMLNLVRKPFRREDLPNCATLNPPQKELKDFFRRHRMLVNGSAPASFQKYPTTDGGADQLFRYLADETIYSDSGPEILALHLDHALAGRL